MSVCNVVVVVIVFATAVVVVVVVVVVDVASTRCLTSLDLLKGLGGDEPLFGDEDEGEGATERSTSKRRELMAVEGGPTERSSSKTLELMAVDGGTDDAGSDDGGSDDGGSDDGGANSGSDLGESDEVVAKARDGGCAS